MTHKLYPRLAWQGITKNKRLYLPFLLTCVGMVMMTYILLSLASSPILQTFPGGDTMPMILGMGSFVMAAFAVLFLRRPCRRHRSRRAARRLSDGAWIWQKSMKNWNFCPKNSCKKTETVIL